MQFNIFCFWISACTPSILQYQDYFISKWTSRLKEWTWKRMFPSLRDDDTHWNLLAFGKLNLYITWKNKLRKMAISHHFSQHFNNYARTIELLHVFWCFLFLLSSFLWTCHIVCDKSFILQPQLSIYTCFFQIFIFYGFKLILSVSDIAALIAPYFSPVLNFL